jgi:predicted glycosyltransferase
MQEPRRSTVGNPFMNETTGSPRVSERVWIDLSNSPHPILFEPIVRELRERGHEVLLTARDHAQTVDLARERWPETEVIGARSPRGRAAKARAVAGRAATLARFARGRGIAVAVSHNSYAQAVAARTLRIPCVTAMDYEYQPANHIAFRCANRVLVPRDFPGRMLRLEGARAAKVWRYEGFKEEVYLHSFAPDPSVLGELGLERDEPFFVARPAPAGAAYHQFENPLFDRALAQALGRHEAKVVLLPRRPEDVRPYAGIPPERQIVPERAVDTRSLLHYARALLGAGGTMNREAALLGTPVFGLYAGRLAALDRRLISEGRLRPLAEDPDRFEAELASLANGSGPAAAAPPAPITRRVLDRFLEAILTPVAR